MSGLEALLDWFAAGKEAAVESERGGVSEAKLRALPREEIFLYVKPIDNSQVRCVARRSEWMSGAMTAAVFLLAALCIIAVIVPQTTVMAISHRIETLKEERAQLLNELRELRSEEAKLRSAEQLEQYAGERFIAPPAKALVYAPPAKSTVASLGAR
jgi:hypothetical protein